MKRYLPLILVALAVVGLGIAVALSTGITKTPHIVPSPTPGAGFRGIDLNTATAGAVVSVMGNPLRVDPGQNQETLIYDSGVGNQPINVSVDTNNRVESVIEPSQQGTKLSAVQSSLGKEDVVLYGNYYYSGYFLYTYLIQGTAVLGNPTTDDVKQRWYFPSTSLSTFLQTAGKGFQTSPLSSGQE